MLNVIRVQLYFGWDSQESCVGFHLKPSKTIVVWQSLFGPMALSRNRMKRSVIEEKKTALSNCRLKNNILEIPLAIFKCTIKKKKERKIIKIFYSNAGSFRSVARVSELPTVSRKLSHRTLRIVTFELNSLTVGNIWNPRNVFFFFSGLKNETDGTSDTSEKMSRFSSIINRRFQNVKFGCADFIVLIKEWVRPGSDNRLIKQGHRFN